MSDIQCRIDGPAGRVTLNRPQALQGLLTHLEKVHHHRLVYLQQKQPYL